MLGGVLALMAAVAFALNNAAFRRGALTGSVAQGMAISLAIGVVIFVVAAALAGAWDEVTAFPRSSFWLLCLAGVAHFAWGRYCNFRATKAMGANLVGPPQQASIIITLVLAILVLGEALTPLRILGILLIVFGPAISLRARKATLGPDSAKPGTKAKDRPGFVPNYVEGYTFALLSALGYGTSPIMVRTALEGGGLSESLAGGLIAYVAASLVMALGLMSSRLRRHVLAVDAVSGKWFSVSGALVCLSQMTGYMALAVAPVSVVTPIQRLSLVFRVFANSALNREHEVIGGRVWAATIVGLIGALCLSISTDYVLDVLPVPQWLEDFARWQWR
jgi:drug/metabolite transporter (DMT)-like permease